MANPYEVLDVSPSATDEEVKAAYRRLAKKYHPDNYTDDSLKDFASEKMKEINGAYDQVVSQRRTQGANGNSYTGYQNTYATSPGGSKYPDVRNFIRSGRINDAEQILNGVPEGNRDAEWYFLKGTILIKKGWTEEAHVHFQKACSMDPSNLEYQQALNFTNNSRNGVYGGYRQNTGRASGCSSCDVCSGLLCADCCCECCGGDIIPCC